MKISEIPYPFVKKLAEERRAFPTDELIQAFVFGEDIIFWDNVLSGKWEDCKRMRPDLFPSDKTLGADPYISTIKGNFFQFLDMEANKFDVDEIAYALSNICRFGGHCSGYYSVAQHSVLVARLVPGYLFKAALFHDAAEAYLGDIPTPLKELLPDYRAINEKVESWVCKNINRSIHDPKIKEADLRMLAAEKRDLMVSTVEWDMLEGVEAPTEIVQPMTPNQAYRMFMEAYDQNC